MADDKHKDALSVFSKKRGELIALCIADGAIVQNDGNFSQMSWMDGGRFRIDGSGRRFFYEKKARFWQEGAGKRKCAL